MTVETPFELIALVDSEFDALGIRYLIVGSIASMFYGEVRMTQDVDLVAELRYGHVAKLHSLFDSPDYYLSESAVRDAVRSGSQFNVILPETGLKIDVMVSEDTAFNRARFARRQRAELAEDCTAWIASVEDVILKKLEYFRNGGSQKHLRDIEGIGRCGRTRIDRDYIGTWIDRLGVRREWELAQKLIDET